MNLNQTQSVKSQPSKKTKGRVLIVDDDRNLCKAFSRVIEKKNYDVHLAHTLKEANRLLSFWKFDSILVDIFLGSEDGMQILKQNLNHKFETPVIIMTGDPSLQTATHALRLNAYDYLQKPISSRQLVHSISRAVELNQLKQEKKRVEVENQYYQKNLERMVATRTEKLIESNKRYKLLFANSKDAIYITKPDEKFLAINQAFIDLTNCPIKKLMQGGIKNLFEDPRKYRNFQEVIQQNQYVKDFEFRLKRKDNSVIECLLTANLINDQNKKISGHQGIIRDITSQKKAERQIREQNKFLKNILESLTHPFMVIDATDYSIKIANTAAQKSKILIGSTCHENRHGKDAPCHSEGYRCTINEVIKTGRPFHTEHVRCDTEGEQRKYEIHAFPLFNEEGKIVQVIQYYLDITEKKRLETIAEAANLMDNLGYIFSGIRHEIGNPLNSVKMALSVLFKNIDNYDRETIEEFIHRSLTELSRVEYLLKALKNFSLFESPVVESVSIENFMNNFLGLVQDDFKRKNIIIKSYITPKATWMRVDHRALHHVLLNLMTNSADALTNCSAPQIDIIITRECEWVQIQVSDNGCGISKEKMSYIFNPFFTSKTHGTGLGLVIVKKMVSKMGGSIKLESIKDKGTSVIMTFPEGDPIHDKNLVGD